MSSLALIFWLIFPIRSLLESINKTEFSVAESCFDAKILSPTKNCASETLKVLDSLNSALLQIKVVSKTVNKKLVPGISLGILNLFASSSMSLSNSAENGRMGSIGSWCSDYFYAEEIFFQIGSSLPFLFNALEIKAIYSENISSFTIQYTSNGEIWSKYNLSEVFTVNSGLSKYNFVPFTARAIRVYLLNPKVYTCAQFEALVTPLTTFKVLPPQDLISALNCWFKLRASSHLFPSHHLKEAYFSYSKASSSWYAENSNKNQWLSISSAVKMRWIKIRIATSDSSAFISSFKVAYSDDGYSWIWYKSGTAISGLSQYTRDQFIHFTPFDALVIRIYSETWTNYISTKIEAYCFEI